MAHYLLSSEKFIKANTPISANIAGKYILSALLEAQEIKMRGVVGSSLLDSLKTKAQAKEIDEEPAYAELLNRMQMALAWLTVVALTHEVSYKVANKGVVKTNDERVINASEREVIMKGSDAQASADHYVAEVQRYLLANRGAFPELAECDCYRMKANLTSSASCPLWLGGVRGQKIYYR